MSSTGIIQCSAGVTTGKAAGYKMARLTVSNTSGVHG